MNINDIHDKYIVHNKMDFNKLRNKAIDKYDYDIDAVCGRYVIDAKSIMGLLSLGIPKEIFIVIHTNNRDVISKFEEDISKWKVEE